MFGITKRKLNKLDIENDLNEFNGWFTTPTKFEEEISLVLSSFKLNGMFVKFRTNYFSFYVRKIKDFYDNIKIIEENKELISDKINEVHLKYGHKIEENGKVSFASISCCEYKYLNYIIRKYKQNIQEIVNNMGYFPKYTFCFSESSVNLENGCEYQIRGPGIYFVFEDISMVDTKAIDKNIDKFLKNHTSKEIYSFENIVLKYLKLDECKHQLYGMSRQD